MKQFLIAILLLLPRTMDAAIWNVTEIPAAPCLTRTDIIEYGSFINCIIEFKSPKFTEAHKK